MVRGEPDPFLNRPVGEREGEQCEQRKERPQSPGYEHEDQSGDRGTRNDGRLQLGKPDPVAVEQAVQRQQRKRVVRLVWAQEGHVCDHSDEAYRGDRRGCGGSPAAPKQPSAHAGN